MGNINKKLLLIYHNSVSWIVHNPRPHIDVADLDKFFKETEMIEYLKLDNVLVVHEPNFVIDGKNHFVSTIIADGFIDKIKKSPDKLFFLYLIQCVENTYYIRGHW